MTDKNLHERLSGFLDLELQGRRWVLNYEEDIGNRTETVLTFHQGLTRDQVVRHLYNLSKHLLDQQEATVAEQHPTSDDQKSQEEEPPH